MRTIRPLDMASVIESLKKTSPLNGSATVAHRLEAFAGWFPHAFVGPICAQYYDEMFDDVVAAIQGACPG